MLNIDHLTEKMKNWPFFLGMNVLLTGGIFLCALIGRSMGIEGAALAISVVWPATGLSLASLILFGYRAAIGVFFGNFIYNYLFFTPYPASLQLIPLHIDIAVFFISLGSCIQALISAYIIKNCSTPLVFRTVQDIFVFLIPASLLSCIVGSTIGVTALTLAGGLDKNLILPLWLTFWLGDTVGIYVITPLVLIWTTQPNEVKFSDHIPSVISITILFGIFSSITYFSGHSLPHLFVPISMWVAYLFRMHGASLAIFIMTVTSILFATYRGYEGTSLISLITFIGVTIVPSLIIASIVNERAQAWALLDSRNIYLEKEVDAKSQIIKDVTSGKRKFTIQNPLTKLFSMEIGEPLNDIDFVTKSSLEALEEIQKLLREQKNLTPSQKNLFAEKLHQIKAGLTDTLNSQKLIAEALENLNLND